MLERPSHAAVCIGVAPLCTQYPVQTNTVETSHPRHHILQHTKNGQTLETHFVLNVDISTALNQRSHDVLAVGDNRTVQCRAPKLQQQAQGGTQ